MRTTALLATLVLTAFGIVATAQNAIPSSAIPRNDSTRKPAPIPGLTDKLGLDEKKIGELLGDVFESQVAGISFRPPADCKQTRQNEPDHVAEFTNDDRHWLLKVTRSRLGQPMPLQTLRVKNVDRLGLLDVTMGEVMKAHPAATVLRQEIINVGEFPVGLAIFRLSIGSEKFLRQQAIFQVNEQLYYIFNLTTLSPKVGNPEMKAKYDELLAKMHAKVAGTR